MTTNSELPATAGPILEVAELVQARMNAANGALTVHGLDSARPFNVTTSELVTKMATTAVQVILQYEARLAEADEARITALTAPPQTSPQMHELLDLVADHCDAIEAATDRLAKGPSKKFARNARPLVEQIRPPAPAAASAAVA